MCCRSGLSTFLMRFRGRFQCHRQAQYTDWVVDVSEIIEQQFHMIQKSTVPQMQIIDKIVHSQYRSCWGNRRTVHRQGRGRSRGQAVTSSFDPSGSEHRRGGDSSRGTGLFGESQGKSPRGSGSQPGGAKRQVHLDGHGNGPRLRAGRWVKVEKIPIAESCDKRGSKGPAV